MSLSIVDKKLISKTQQYIELLKHGDISPQNANEHLSEFIGPYSDYYDEDSFWKWEVTIIGVIAHETSKILGTFPVVILDYDRSSVRTHHHSNNGSHWESKTYGQYVFDAEKRPANRPRPPHRIEDKFIVSLANRKIGESVVNEQVVVLPIIANYNNRSVFETAVIALFPTVGAFAFRKRANTNGRNMKKEFDRVLQKHDDFENKIIETDPLDQWIIEKTPGSRFASGGRDSFVMLASFEAVNIIYLLAERFQK